MSKKSFYPSLGLAQTLRTVRVGGDVVVVVVHPRGILNNKILFYNNLYRVFSRKQK